METEKIPLTLIEKAMRCSEDLGEFYHFEEVLVTFDSEIETVKFYDRDTDMLISTFPF